MKIVPQAAVQKIQFIYNNNCYLDSLLSVFREVVRKEVNHGKRKSKVSQDRQATNNEG